MTTTETTTTHLYRGVPIEETHWPSGERTILGLHRYQAASLDEARAQIDAYYAAHPDAERDASGQYVTAVPRDLFGLPMTVEGEPTTTTERYDDELETATNQIVVNLSRAGITISDDLEKSIQDALNNSWVEGLTVDQWVRDAVALLGLRDDLGEAGGPRA